MRRLVLKAILRLGRYAVLPIVAVAGAVFVVWLMAIDRYTILALATAPIVLSATPAAIALALGILLLPSRKDRSFKADEAAAPGLWSIWKELDHAFARPDRTLVIDANFNASIQEESRYAGLFRRHVTMTVGLPLLIILDERAIRAVIAHEVAHARLQHTSGGSNLFDFIAASENVLYYADPDRTITGRIADALLHSLLEWLWKEYLTLSRENELQADGGAAEQVGRDEMARALVLMEGCGARLSDLVYTPLEKEMLGAIRAPTPPLQRIFRHLADIRAPDQLPAAAAAGSQKHEQEPDSTHPPLGKRLANLGFSDIPPLDKVESSAIDQLLSPEAAKELRTRFDDEWGKKVAQLVGVGV
ncbi:M48 family metalloprotease [Bradyrhizobium lablabi]|uniref:M48 family metalloprotease n=1 Tax=Bradyrhizobium lablabi TaxID=722472 RepID=UPI001BA689F6|nr:M48 family metallopeptidase [Bradyrhizobium lablabi]MBR1126126.1 M48 family metalloprotease [Bradyrhizobium lablabi]